MWSLALYLVHYECVPKEFRCFCNEGVSRLHLVKILLIYHQADQIKHKEKVIDTLRHLGHLDSDRWKCQF